MGAVGTHVNPDGGLRESDSLRPERQTGESQGKCGREVCVLEVGLSRQRNNRGKDPEGITVANSILRNMNQALYASHILALSNLIFANIIIVPVL